MGLVVLGAIGMYLLISVVVVIGAIDYARKHGKNGAGAGERAKGRRQTLRPRRIDY